MSSMHILALVPEDMAKDVGLYKLENTTPPGGGGGYRVMSFAGNEKGEKGDTKKWKMCQKNEEIRKNKWKCLVK
jgi:hypothetical protein